MFSKIESFELRINVLKKLCDFVFKVMSYMCISYKFAIKYLKMQLISVINYIFRQQKPNFYSADLFLSYVFSNECEADMRTVLY